MPSFFCAHTFFSLHLCRKKFQFSIFNSQFSILNSPMTTQTMTQLLADYFKTQPVTKAWLFGSYARGEQRPDSDVDILVEYDRTHSIGLFKISKIQLALENLLGKEVDLVDAETLFPWVVESVNHDKELIYARTN